MMSMNDLVVIRVEILKIESGCYSRKEFNELFTSMILYLSSYQVNSCQNIKSFNLNFKYSYLKST